MTSPHRDGELGDDAIIQEGDEGNGAAADEQPKHPLEHTWALWRSQPGTAEGDEMSESQIAVCNFGYVEEFWQYFHNIWKPSGLGDVDVSCFKHMISPSWDDETCRRGGRWMAEIEDLSPEDLDEVWLNMLLVLIGESFDDFGGRCICGTVISPRLERSSKVSLWLSEHNKHKVVPLGHAFRSVLRDAASFEGELSFEDFSVGGPGHVAFLLSEVSSASESEEEEDYLESSEEQYESGSDTTYASRTSTDWSTASGGDETSTGAHMNLGVRGWSSISGISSLNLDGCSSASKSSTDHFTPRGTLDA